MTMSSGPAGGAAAGREDLTAARGFTGPLAFVSAWGVVTALDRPDAGVLGAAGGGAGRSAVLAGGFGPGFFTGRGAGPGDGVASAFVGAGTAGSGAAAGFADFPGTAGSTAGAGCRDFRGAGFGDGSDADGIERFLAIDLSGA